MLDYAYYHRSLRTSSNVKAELALWILYIHTRVALLTHHGNRKVNKAKARESAHAISSDRRDVTVFCYMRCVQLRDGVAVLIPCIDRYWRDDYCNNSQGEAKGGGTKEGVRDLILIALTPIM